jgi:hypothetical protein
MSISPSRVGQNGERRRRLDALLTGWLPWPPLLSGTRSQRPVLHERRMGDQIPAA